MLIEGDDQHKRLLIRFGAAILVGAGMRRFPRKRLLPDCALVKNLILIGQDRHPQPIGGDIRLELLEISPLKSGQVFSERMMLHDAISRVANCASDDYDTLKETRNGQCEKIST